MAITYHAGRRIQGLATNTTSTFTSDLSSNTGWTTSNSGAIAVDTSNEDISWTVSRGNNDSISYDLGSVMSNTEWVLRFRTRWTTIGGQSATNQQWFGLSSANSSVDSQTAQYFIGFMTSNFITTTQFRSIESYNSGAVTANGDYGSTPTRSANTWYYYEIKRTSATTFELSVSSTDAYTKDIIGAQSITITSSLINLRYIKMFNENAGTGNDGTASETKDFQFNNNTTSITTTTGDTKPTNVQVGSRYEETDTRKMYHYNSNTYASSTPNLATSSIVIGDGGAYNGGTSGRIGDDSTAFGLTAKGGGAGLNHTIASSYKDGGSSGGQTSEGGTIGATTQTSQSGDSGTYGYGNLGGQASPFSNTYISTGGGGGSFSRGIVGGSASTSTNGGDGLGGTNNTAINQFLIDSSAGFQDGSTGYYYIAGGGGGGNQRNAGTAAVAGKGGGGDGCIDNGTNAGDGAANTGSGGGGGGNNNSHEGNGGKGICIIKYKTSEITATGGNNTYVVGDYTYRKFTSSGTLTVSSGTGKYDVLLIAGGGAGYDSAGGAGGLVYRNGLQIFSWSEEGT